MAKRAIPRGATLKTNSQLVKGLDPWNTIDVTEQNPEKALEAVRGEGPYYTRHCWLERVAGRDYIVGYFNDSRSLPIPVISGPSGDKPKANNPLFWDIVSGREESGSDNQTQ
jgi:hypothetical protein